MSTTRHTTTTPSQPPQQATSSSNSIPQSLMLTDYLRPVFMEASMIREYCLFTQIQQSGLPGENQSSSSVTSSQEGLNQGNAKALTGVYVIPSAQTPYLWFGLLCINNDRSNIPSPWNGGVFRFFIRFPENYPTSGWPTITFLPTSTQTHPLSSSSTTPTTTPPNQYTTITTHPEISPSSGQFSVRAYATSSNSTSTSYIPRTYRILRLLRKSFYRQFTEVEVQNSVNPSAAEMCGRDYQEFLRNCAIDAAESLKFLRETDKFVSQKFKGDLNLILLWDGEGRNATTTTTSSGGGGKSSEEQINGVEEVNKKQQRNRTLGLSFMGRS